MNKQKISSFSVVFEKLCNKSIDSEFRKNYVTFRQYHSKILFFNKIFVIFSFEKREAIDIDEKYVQREIK